MLVSLASKRARELFANPETSKLDKYTSHKEVGKALEEIAESFEGVERCFAIQAGREIRVMVKPDQVDDAGAAVLVHDIVKKIEGDLEYPGQIKATVIRETRVVDYAK